MRLLAVMLVGCILFLSSFSGEVIRLPAAAKMSCCKKTIAKDFCAHKSSKKETGGCNKPGCAMMFACSICGFLPVEGYALSPSFALILKKSVPLHNPGNLSRFDKADWKPPKAVK